MAVVSRVTKLRLDNGAGSAREWVATAAAQDTPAGSSVTVTITTTTSGPLPPPQEDVLEIYFHDTSAQIRGFALAPGAASQTVMFFFTSNGLTGGAPRAGTIEIILRVVRTSGAAGAGNYEVFTSGGPNNPPTGYNSIIDRGWIRGTTTAALSVSNVAAGGATPATFGYPDTIFQRLTLAAPLFLANTFTVTAGNKSGVTNSTTGPTFDRTHTGAVDNTFPASASSQAQSVTPGNSGLTGLPHTVLTSTTAPAFTVDPRLTRTPLFQLDDNTFASPPDSKNVPSHLRQTTQQGFLAGRFVNARGEGQNGVTYDVSLTPSKPGTALTLTGQVTVTQGGQTGCSPQFLAWASSLPGGTWTKAVTVTAPANITGAAYLVNAGNDTYTLVAKDPSLDVRLNVQHKAGEGGRHFIAGMGLIPTAYLLDVSTGVRMLASQITSAQISVVRASAAANPDGSGTRWEFLDAAGVWVPWLETDPVYRFPMTPSTADATTFERVFSTDASWGVRDIRFNVSMVVGGVTYFTTYIVVNVDGKNNHDAYAFDGAGFVGFPSR